MALSEREQQVLRDLESQLHQDDPDLAQTLQREERRLSRPSPRHIGGGVALVLIGFLVAVAGVAMALTRVESGSSSRQSSAEGGRTGQGKSGTKKRSSFMDRQSERWERRRDAED